MQGSGQFSLTGNPYLRAKSQRAKEPMRTKLLSLLSLSLISAAFAEDFKTTDGKEYKGATVSRIEPDGIVVKTKSGISKLYFTELPKEVQERFRYDRQKAGNYSAEQAADYAVHQKEQEQTRRQQESVAAQKKAAFAKEQTLTNRIQALQDRYAALQHQEDNLLLQIGEAKKPGPAYWGGTKNKTLRHYPNPQKSQLPLLESHLKDVRHEKDQVRKQLEKAQR
jgi:hypothetical protein